MNNPDIYRYERELRRAVKGIRCRKRVLKAFRKSLLMLLEEVDTPTYSDLEVAFGPPKQMAEDLLETIPDLPKPLTLRRKMGIAVSFCLIVLVVCLSVFQLKNTPELEGTILDELEYTNDVFG